MSSLNFLFIAFPILAILHGILSVIAKIILKSNGYKIKYFITEFRYETKILKVICKEKKSLYPILITYYIVTILFLVDFALFIIFLFFK
jgi:hypothetical protein